MVHNGINLYSGYLAVGIFDPFVLACFPLHVFFFCMLLYFIFFCTYAMQPKAICRWEIARNFTYKPSHFPLTIRGPRNYFLLRVAATTLKVMRVPSLKCLQGWYSI